MTTTYAIRIHAPGGPEALRWEEVPVPPPGPLEVQIRQSAVGLNYIDTYHRSGQYPLALLPAVLGMEGAGVVESVGSDVGGFQPGERVAYASALGAYADRRNVPAAQLVRLPDTIDDRAAAAMMLKGLTAQYLVRRTHRVHPGETILIHAAAGGVGLIVCQWANALGATVIGTVGSDDKADLARRNGCHHPIVYTRENFIDRVREITGGKGVRVVYDSVGATTFMGSLDCLAPFGLVALFGQSSGPVPPLDLQLLSAKGSLYVTRPTLMTHTAGRDRLEEGARELFDMVASGKVKIDIGQTFPLAETANAHRALESRQTTGSTVLLV